MALLVLGWLSVLGVLSVLFAVPFYSVWGEEISDEEITLLRRAAQKIEEGTKQMSLRYEMSLTVEGKVVSASRDGYGHIDLPHHRCYYRCVQYRESQPEDVIFQKVFNEKEYRCHYWEHEKEPYKISVSNLDERYKDVPSITFDIFCNILNRLLIVRDDPDSPAGVEVFSPELSKIIDQMTFTRITDENGKQLLQGKYRQENVWWIVVFDPDRDYHWSGLRSIVELEDEEGIFRQADSVIREWTDQDGIFLPATIEKRFSHGTFDPQTWDFTENKVCSTEEYLLTDYNLQNSADDFYLHDIPDGTMVYNSTVEEVYRRDYIWKGGKVVLTDKRHGLANQPPRMSAKTIRRWLIAAAIILLLGSIGWKLSRFWIREKA